MKFDIVVGNPPYQAPQNAKGKRGGGAKLWDKFLLLALDLLKDDGYLCFVHPAVWRKPGNRLWDLITNLQVLYLEIHDIKDGMKTFGAATRYDFYVLQNKECLSTTIVIDETGRRRILDLRDWQWLPNCEFELIGSLISVGEDTIDILFSDSAYETRQKFMSDQFVEIQYSRGNYGSDRQWMQDNEDTDHPYPCVHTTPKTKPIRYYWSSRNDRGFFGIPKVIFGDGRSIVPIIDMKGKFGMTQDSMAIPVDSEQEAQLIARAIGGEKFDRVVLATKWSNFRIDYSMFKYFRKDFYKDFL